MAMGGVFDSLGLSLAFAGAGILLAGLLLTPMRSIVLNSLRSRRSQEVEVPLPPAAAPPAPPQPAAVVQAAAPRPAVPARASEAIAVAREQDALFARALVTAQRTAEDMVRRAKFEAQDILDKAQTTADDILGTARRNASEMLQKAEEEVQTIVGYADERATTRLAVLQAEVERIVVEANQTFQSAERSVQQSVASLSSRLELQMRDGDTGSNGNGHDPASRADGSRLSWLVSPSADDDGAAVGVGADGAPAADRQVNRIG